MSKKQSFVIIDLKSPVISLSPGVSVIFSEDIKAYLTYISSISNTKDPTHIYTTTDGHLYTQISTGEILYYQGDELEKWRKEWSN